MFRPSPTPPNPMLLRLFALSWSLFLGAAAAWAYHLSADSLVWVGILVAVSVFATGLFLPSAVRPLYFSVERILWPLGQGISFFLLAVIYFVVFTPFAVVMRLAGRDVLRIRSSGRNCSGWVKKDAGSGTFGYYGQY